MEPVTASSDQSVAEREALVAFRLGASNLGVEASAVLSIEPLATPAPMPGAPPWIAGLLPLRGGAVALLELSRFVPLGRVLRAGATDSAQDDLRERVIVLEADRMRVGIRCERVFGVVHVPRGVGAGASTHGQKLSEFIVSEHEQPFGLLLRLDLSKLLLAARLR